VAGTFGRTPEAFDPSSFDSRPITVPTLEGTPLDSSPTETSQPSTEAAMRPAAELPSTPTAQEPAAAPLERFEASHRAMGVEFVIVGYASDETTARRAVTEAFARVDRLNDILSDYDPESEASRLAARFTADPAAAPIDISPELAVMLREGIRWSRETDGAFDLTVGPLTRLWRPARRSGVRPDAAALAAARQSVGWEKIEIAAEVDRVRLAAAGMGLDFGGIAQGYAADEMLTILRSHGIDRCLIDASGDVRLGNPPPDQPAWQVGVAPLDPSGAPGVRLAMTGGSVSTSGDAFQFVEIDGRRYSHLIDPRTGEPLEGRSSVTVIADDGVTADAVASALSVMGPDAGVAWAEAHDGIEVLFVTLVDDRPVVRKSRGFDRFIAVAE